MKYINKDITTIDAGIIAHGVNCQGVMGAGVAKAIRDKWPIVYERYKGLPTGAGMLGSAHMVNIVDSTLYVFNCYTQVFYGKNGRFANADAIRKSLDEVFGWASAYFLTIYLPKIGAGLGGLDWKTEVEPIIKELETKYPTVNVAICEYGE